jgi:hypothetical protein
MTHDSPDPITSFLQDHSPKLTPEQQRRLNANLKRRERYAKKKNLNWKAPNENRHV